ncbi:MAG: amidase, partial [Candidatus Hydrogenedentota bacterium]
MEEEASTTVDRRAFMAYFSGTGLAATLLPGVLWTQVASAQSATITADMVQAAEKLAGLEFSDEERSLIARGVSRNVKQFESIRDIPISYDVPPAFIFNPLPLGYTPPSKPGTIQFSAAAKSDRPNNIEALAHWSVIDLAGLIQSRKVTSRELTEMYLSRLNRFDPDLNCVITLTEKRAL